MDVSAVLLASVAWAALRVGSLRALPALSVNLSIADLVSSNGASMRVIRKTIPTLVAIAIVAAAAAIPSEPVFARIEVTGLGASAKGKQPASGVYEIRGEGFVHNVGNLWVNVTNLGVIGNPWKNLSTDPSAQYPPGSGIEYLFGAGIWVGARVGEGQNYYVSTALPATEFRPNTLPVGTIYESYEGFPGGSRFVNDDGDFDDYGRELIDEDVQDGIDNDDDGLIDEDFAAISQQMFTCVYRDDTEEALNTFAEHVPMGLEVVQKSFAWGIPGSDNFVGLEFTIKNDGRRDLHDVYLGFFCDADAGSEATDEYWRDDRAGLVTVDTTLGSPTSACQEHLELMIGETHDGDGDGGTVDGWFGAMFLGHTTDPTGRRAPPKAGFSSFRFVSGGAAYEQCGDPANDYQRYDLLSSRRIGCRAGETEARSDSDYRIFFGTGPFKDLQVGEELTLQVGLVVGPGKLGMIRNAIAAQRIYNGTYEDIDGDPNTGVDGKETCLTALPGETYVFAPIEHCGLPDTLKERPEYRPVAIVAPNCDGANIGQWVDFDCDMCTGIDGKEKAVRWRGASTPPCPQVLVSYPRDEGYPCHELRTDEQTGLVTRQDIRGPAVQLKSVDNGVIIRWNNAAELVPDPFSKRYDFAGYRIWKAEQWERPVGSTGPQPELWSLLAEYRLPQFLEENTKQLDLLRARNPAWSRITPCDTVDAESKRYLYPVGYYQHRDTHVLNGFTYFYAVTAFDMNLLDDRDPVSGERMVLSLECRHVATESQAIVPAGDPAPTIGEVFVVPNPYYGGAPWDLTPNPRDPTGTHVDFMNLPRGPWKIRIYTLAGDLVRSIENDGTQDVGQARWDLVSRNGQDIASGIYLFSVESRYGSQVGKFVIMNKRKYTR